MKSHLFILLFSLFFSFCAFAQNKVTVKVTLNQPEQLDIVSTGDPAFVGDESKLDVNGGTPPYAYTWEEQTETPNYTHTVTVEDANKCTSLVYVNVDGWSDIEEIGVESNIYPNPTSDIVNVPLPATGEKVVILLINADGLVLSKKALQTSEASYQLSLASYPSGIYFIQVAGNKTKNYSIIKK